MWCREGLKDVDADVYGQSMFGKFNVLACVGLSFGAGSADGKAKYSIFVKNEEVGAQGNGGLVQDIRISSKKSKHSQGAIDGTH